MLGLRSQFGPQVVALALLAGLSLVAAGVRAARRRGQTMAAITAAGQVLAVGAALCVVAVAAAPLRAIAAVDRRGDLARRLGDGGLRQIAVLRDDPGSLAALLLLLNVIMFAPVGFLGLIGWPARAPWVLIGCLVLSLAIEAAQLLFLGRVAATDDVVLNMTGSGAGALLAMLVLRRRSRGTAAS